MQMREFFFEESQVDEIAAAFLQEFKSERTFFFKGNLGVGKTTFIKAVCKHLGVEGGLSSPTYAIVNEYKTTAGEPVYHIDLYRLEDENEAKKIGIAEYLESGYYCFVEWPQLILPYFDGVVCEMSDELNCRKLSIFKSS